MPGHALALLGLLAGLTAARAQGVALATAAAVSASSAPAAAVAASSSPAVAVSSAPAGAGTLPERPHAPPVPPASELDVISIGGYRFTMSMPLLFPFEKLLHASTGQIQIDSVENVPVYFNGNVYRYNLPPTPEQLEETRASTAAAAVRVLESEYGFFLLSPPDQALMKEFEAAVRNPQSFASPQQPQISLHSAELRSAQAPEGDVYTLTIDSPRPTVGQWRKSLALLYRLWVRDRPIDALFIYKTQGGLARLATSIEETRKNGRSTILVSRGSLAAHDVSLVLEGRERLDALSRLGLQVSAVGLGELRHWDALESFRQEASTGTRYISANLVYSTAAAVTVLPPSALLHAAGLKIAFIGLTRPSYGKYMTTGKLQGLRLADPILAARAQVAGLRSQADLVIALSNLEGGDNARLRDEVRGIDAILADDEPFLPDPEEPISPEVFAAKRRAYDPCLLLASEFSTALDRLGFSAGLKGPYGERSLRIHQSHLVLDESVADHAGYPEFGAEAYGVVTDTQPPLIPAPRSVFPEGSPRAAGVLSALTSRDFWTMAATLVAARTRSEAGLLPVHGISLRTTGEIREGMVKDWFTWDDALVTFEISGRDLSELISEIHDQEKRELAGLPEPNAKLRLAAGGLGAADTIHGVPIDPTLVYRVAGTQLMLGNAEAYPALGRVKNVELDGDLRDTVLAELRSGAKKDWPPERYRNLMLGLPERENSFWKVNFRDISVNASNTDVLRDDSFSAVPNSRIQGFNQQLIGVSAKIDVDYLYREYKWSNNFLLDYSRARLHPPGLPTITNLPTNQLSFATSGTRRVGSFPYAWMGRAYGPSLGFDYEGEVERNPTPRRKNIFYVYPGLELFNGTVLQSVAFSANLKRDLSRIPPNDQYGLRARILGASPIRNGLMTLQGETWVNYFALTHTDTLQDLRLEGDANLKLQIPIFKRFTLAPFIDFYYFQLKLRPLTGYSAITGLSLGFSRLWKPQYEKF